MPKNLIYYLEKIPDFREPRGCRHRLSVGKRSGGLKKKKDKPFPSSHKIRQLSKSHLHQNK